MLGAPAMAQPCNPVIDGTYCATQTIRRSDAPTSSGVSVQGLSMHGLARDMGPWTDQPGMLGGITSRGGATCIGLLRRGTCS
jgi:hypothetical protein